MLLSMRYDRVEDGSLGPSGASCLRLVSLTRQVTVAIESGLESAFSALAYWISPTGTTNRWKTTGSDKGTIGGEVRVILGVAVQLTRQCGV